MGALAFRGSTAMLCERAVRMGCSWGSNHRPGLISDLAVDPEATLSPPLSLCLLLSKIQGSLRPGIKSNKL